MNRLQRLLNDRLGLASDSIDAELREHVADSSQSMMAPPSLGFAHRLFIPEHYEARYEYPLLVWLHSDHSSEGEIDAVMEATSMRNYLAIAPRAHRVSKRSSRLFRWGTNIADLAVAEDLVMESIDELVETLPVCPSRIFIGGIGTGATVAQWIGLKHGSQFSGVVAINGPFPKSRRALTSWKQARGLPVLFMQGERSGSCGDDDLVEAMQMAHAAGLNFRFARFEDPSHESDHSEPGPNEDIDVEMFAAANRFMMGIVTQTDIPLTPEESADSMRLSTTLTSTFGLN